MTSFWIETLPPILAAIFVVAILIALAIAAVGRANEHPVERDLRAWLKMSPAGQRAFMQRKREEEGEAS